jgi:hypothetical protein
MVYAFQLVYSARSASWYGYGLDDDDDMVVVVVVE